MECFLKNRKDVTREQEKRMINCKTLLSTHPQGEQNDTKKCSEGVNWQKKTKKKNTPPKKLRYRPAKCLKMYKISNKVIKLITETMKNWKVELTEGEKILAEVKIPRVMFQGDALSPFLSVIAMMPLNNILKKCIGATNLLNLKKRLTIKSTWTTSCKRIEIELIKRHIWMQ